MDQKQPNQQPQSPQSIYPNPEDQTQQKTEPPNQPAKSSSNKTVWIIIGSCLGLVIIAFGIFALMTYVGLNSAKSRAKDAKIKSNISQLRSLAELYYDQKQTYVGFTGDAAIRDDIQNAGSTLVIQGLSDKTYVIYAKSPNSQTIFCVDRTGVINEIPNINPAQTSCK